MLCAIAVPGFISEYLRLYATALAIIVAISLFVRRLPGQLRSIRAASWPLAQGTIETVKVRVVSDQALGRLAYSYVANGERYSGYFFLQFVDEQDTWDTIDPLKGQTIFIRYNSSNPSISAVRTPEQLVTFATHQGNFIPRLITRRVLGLLGFDWRRWTSFPARNWPVTKGHVEYTAVTQRDDSPILLLLRVYMAEVSYSYCVGGEYYSGRFERSFFERRPPQPS